MPARLVVPETWPCRVRQFDLTIYAMSLQVYRWRMTELWGFPFCFLAKLWVGLRDPHENWTRNASRLALLFTLPGLMDHFPSDYAGKLRMAIEHEIEADS